MYELVETDRQQRNFETTWEYFCAKFGWENDPYAEDGNRYNLLLHREQFYRRRKVIGTIEFIPYDPNNPNSTVEGPGKFEFSKFGEIRLHQDQVWEIDKLCIHQDYQRLGHFHVFLQIIYDHAIEHNTKYYLGLIEKKLFRMLRISLGLSVEQKGDALVGPTTALIPTVFNMEKMLEDEVAVRNLFNNVTLARSERQSKLLSFFSRS